MQEILDSLEQQKRYFTEPVHPSVTPLRKEREEIRRRFQQKRSQTDVLAAFSRVMKLYQSEALEPRNLQSLVLKYLETLARVGLVDIKILNENLNKCESKSRKSSTHQVSSGARDHNPKDRPRGRRRRHCSMQE